MYKDLFSPDDAARLAAARDLGIPLWVGRATVEKRQGDWSGDQILAGVAPDPYEVVRGGLNLLMYGGASCLWELLEGLGTGTAGQLLTYFNNANAAIGVGDSSTGAVATQTDLQAASNKDRNAMDATYPLHTDGTTSAAATVDYKATFGSSEANFAWAEWGVFNSPTAATGRMLNRKVEALGTKTSGTTWSISVSLTLA